MSTKKRAMFVAALAIMAGFLISGFHEGPAFAAKRGGSGSTGGGVSAATVTSPYLYNFNTAQTTQEAAGMAESLDPYWWVSSGAYLLNYGYTGHTVQGSLPATDYWRQLYATTNPVDTDGGYHPQNIFRLVGRSTWQDAREESLFLINNVNVSASPNRNASNGLLFFSRYKDQYNTYYAGIRVDGAAVIKKKQNGTYYTLAYVPGVFAGTYNHATNPNLITIHHWLGLRLETVNQSDGSVRLTLYLDRTNSGAWEPVATAIDAPGKYGTGPMAAGGYMGIRTDFMDVSFDNFRMTAL